LTDIKLEKDSLVHLRWLDSTNISGGWIYDALTANAKEIETIGFVVDADNKAVMVSSTRSNTGGIVNPITIPLGCIQEYRIVPEWK
jgi:hypothetical protein